MRLYNLEPYYETLNGKLFHADNLEVLSELEANTIDSCISDIPYGISFMGKKWDKTNHYYEWNKARADKLAAVMKPGGYAAIFGHPKTNHHMKHAFEDAGFRIVEEIEWVYMTGMPKNQDIGKLFYQVDGAKRSDSNGLPDSDEGIGVMADGFGEDDSATETTPETVMAKRWCGWKTAGLKPAHEPITVFQKPLAGTYTTNIEKYGCGGMNIDACRVPISSSDMKVMNAKASRNPTSNYSKQPNKVYGKFAKEICNPANELGRFPSNVIFDEIAAKEFDLQTGISKSSGGEKSKGALGKNIYGGGFTNKSHGAHTGGLGDIGGGSRLFPIIHYCHKVSRNERMLPDGQRNPHITLKPVALIKWLIQLLTPLNGVTIDITAGSGTHALACETLNKNEGYAVKWIDIEIQNTQEEPYCLVAKKRIEAILEDEAFR